MQEETAILGDLLTLHRTFPVTPQVDISVSDRYNFARWLLPLPHGPPVPTLQ